MRSLACLALAVLVLLAPASAHALYYSCRVVFSGPQPETVDLIIDRGQLSRPFGSGETGGALHLKAVSGITSVSDYFANLVWEVVPTKGTTQQGKYDSGHILIKVNSIWAIDLYCYKNKPIPSTQSAQSTYDRSGHDKAPIYPSGTSGAQGTATSAEPKNP